MTKIYIYLIEGAEGNPRKGGNVNIWRDNAENFPEVKKDGSQTELRKQTHTCIHHSDTVELQRPRDYSLNCGVEKIDHLEFYVQLSLNNKCKGRNFSEKNENLRLKFSETMKGLHFRKKKTQLEKNHNKKLENIMINLN